MHDVLITGAGPTGLSAALLLTERGQTVRVLDKASGTSEHSKAFGVNPRTLSLLEGTGVTEALLASGRRMGAVNAWRRTAGRTRPLFRVDLTEVEHRYPFMLVHSQAKSEAILAEAVSDRGVEVEWGVEVTGVEADAEAVTATLRRGDDGEDSARAGLLLGADGPRSTVRKALGVDFLGSAYEEPWKLYDLELDVPLDRDEAHVFLLNDGGMFVVRLADDVWRVLGNVPDLLDRLPSGTRTGRVVWESDFGISHRVAARFGVGRVCLAGDAAHIHSGLGARGMNLGVEDAFVYASLVAEGRVGDYDALRRPVVTDLMDQIERMTAIPRGQSFVARAVRPLAPVLASLVPLGAGPARRFVLGLDHEVDLVPQAV
jgi:2-polyprenyl-6-methoxyphenol hydroxylase-like FAD-dependent oxidoreductase